MTGFASTFASIWRLATPYFRGEDRWPGRILLAAVIAIELGIVSINVGLNWWNARFYNAVQDRDWTGFVHELLVFCMLAAGYIDPQIGLRASWDEVSEAAEALLDRRVAGKAILDVA